MDAGLLTSPVQPSPAMHKQVISQWNKVEAYTLSNKEARSGDYAGIETAPKFGDNVAG